MSSFTFFVVCIQAFFIQAALSQVISTGYNSGLGNLNYGLGGVSNAGIVSSGFTGFGGVQDVAAIAQLPVSGPYGGVGTGEISVSGDVSAAGQTVVTGQVPVIGSVSFSGQIPASGIVSIAGNCGCANVPL